MDFTEFKAFDNLNTEIIILDGDNFQLLWINDAAKAANWISDSSKFTEKTISSLLDEETGSQINEILKKTRENTGSVTKRDFEIVHRSGTSRTVDLTITFSEKKNLIFIEAVSIDNLNKIIDSTKTFSTQKIAANLARTLAHEVKNPLSGIRGSAQILDKKLKLNNQINIDPSKKVSYGDTLELIIPEPKIASLKPYKYKLDIIYEDEDLIVINKPAGIVMHPGAGNFDKTIVNALINYDKNSLSNIGDELRPGIVHRICLLYTSPSPRDRG